MKKLLYALVKQLITLYCGTWRYRYHNDKELIEEAAAGRPSIVVLWHDQLLPLTYSWRGREIGTIASQSKDGDIITEMLHKWGYTVARGSSTRGGARALIGAKKILGQGINLAVTVDGPRGPRHVVKTGAVFIAKMTGSPICMAFMKCKRYIRFNSWDKFILPLPFSRIDVYFTHRIVLSGAISEESVEKDRLELEKIMLEQTVALTPDFI